MIASELAPELNIDAGVLSKRLNLYFRETGEERQKVLSDQTIQHMREVNNLIDNNQARNSRMAVLMVLGKYVEAAPPNSVLRIENLLLQLLESQSNLSVKFDRFLDAISHQNGKNNLVHTLPEISSPDVDRAFARFTEKREDETL